MSVAFDHPALLAVVDDIEQALFAHWSQFGTLHDDDGLLWFETPIARLPYNGVIRTRLGGGADRAIAAAIARFARRGVEFLWFDHPSAAPADLGERLAAHGLRAVEHIACMSLDLAGWVAPPLPEGVAVREAVGGADAQAYTDLTLDYWQIPGDEQPLVVDLHRGWSRAAGRRYLAVAGGRPVGKAYLSLAGPPGVAAIFGMSVRPEVRGRGVASGLTTALLRAAREAGCRSVVLHSTGSAVGVYRRAGFVERCPLTIFASAPLWPRSLTSRRATRADIPALEPLMRAAIDELQVEYLDPAELAASRAIMGLDERLIDDGTYYLAECDGQLAGCGGWSRRAGFYSTGGGGAMLDPARDAARVRAMYTHPRFARRGVGRLILGRCEAEAAAAGFTRLEVMSTLAGEPLYRAAGFAAIERVVNEAGGHPVPLIRMGKAIAVRE